MKNGAISPQFIPVSTPLLGERELQYVNNALQASAISGTGGAYLARFETEFSEYCECKHGIAVSNGTTALHLALAALRIGPGDEVLTSTLTNMATFFAILYQGAKPVPIDIEEDTLNMDPALLESRITSRTKAILVVHLFGHPVDMDPVQAIARKHGLYVIEDAAEAHGATYKGKKAGALSDVACFSFYANKIITTGEGGMVTTNDDALADRLRLLRGLAYGNENRFMHQDVGFNYRLTNLQAALGCAQLEGIEQVVEKKRLLAKRYDQLFSNIQDIQRPVEKPYAKNVYWMYHVVLRGALGSKRNEVMKRLRERGVDTRESFVPYNAQQLFIERGWTSLDECPVAVRVGQSGLYLPSTTNLTEEQVAYIASALIDVLSELRNEK